jgi:hypothetical protein
MKGSWISLTGQVETSISSLGRTKAGNSMATPGQLPLVVWSLGCYWILIINRMAGPVRRGGQNIHWATSPRSNQSPTISSRLSSQSSVPIYFSPGDHRLVDSSPLPVDSLHVPVKTPTDSHVGQQDAPHYQSAPGRLGGQYKLPSINTPEMKLSLDQQQRQFKAKHLPPAQKDNFELDPLAPVRAMRSTAGKPGSTSLHPLEKVEERAEPDDDVVQESASPQQEEKGEDLSQWGECFAVEWISTRKLPFNRTRQIRNPWNHDREVKVSRDGTELEPTVGQKLLDDWFKLSEPEQQETLTFEGLVRAA